MAALSALAEFVTQHRSSGRTRDAVRLHVADTIGAWIAATATGEGRALIRYRPADAVPADQIAINCALTRLSEVDDICLGAMITPGSIVIPAALTIAASMPDPPAGDVAASIVAGYEAMVRLGTAIEGPSVLYRGIWPTYFAAPFGVAAVASRLLKLDAPQCANALATALIMASAGTGHHAAPTTARWLTVGYAAARGLQAALSAQSGFTSDVKLAEGDLLKGIYGLDVRADILAEGFAEPAIERTSFKPWCAARQTMAATQALRELMVGGVSSDSIISVEAAVLPPHLKMIDHGVTPGDRFSYLTSLPYQIAVAAVAPDDAYRLNGPSERAAPAISAFMSRVALCADEAMLQAGYPDAWPAHVVVTTSSGRRDLTVTHVPGDPGRPVAETDVQEKFRKVTAPALSSEQADAMFARSLGVIERPGAFVQEIALLGTR
jgi:2-methylcitrate dehydratase PrpD